MDAVVNGVKFLLERVLGAWPTTTFTIMGEDISFRRTTATELEYFRTAETDIEAIERLLRQTEKDDVVWDIGANVGLYSCSLGTHRRVVSIEPYPPNTTRLLTNRRLNELDFTHLSLALSDDSDVRRFDVPRAGIRAAEGTLVGADDVEETIFVSTARADQLIDDEVVPVPTAVKIDVEGATPAVLRGFGDYLGEISLAYIETHGDKQRTEDLLREYGLEPSDSTSKGTMYVAE